MDKDLLERITEVSGGSAGRVCLNLAAVAKLAADTGMDKVGLQDWGKRQFLSGDRGVGHGRM